MLSKDKRLNLKKDFKWVVSGEKTENSLLKLFFRFGENFHPRVGIAVSSSVFKKAVERNRARRLVSRGFEQLYLRLATSVNIVALPKAEVLKFTSEKISKELEQLLQKSNLLNKNEESNN